jgi:poly(ADP-ribose) glycohydrolase ARH3
MTDMFERNREIGCILGLTIGDAMCAPFEGGFLERAFWYFFGKTKDGKLRWTDDTQMSIDVINSLLSEGGLNQNHLAQTFAESYKWSRGYGPSAGRVLKKIRKGSMWADVNCSVYKQGSFGNGAAMRVPALIVYYKNQKDLIDDVIEKSSIITHAHPYAIEGAKIVGHAVLNALCGEGEASILESAKSAAKSDVYLEKIKIAERLYGESINDSPKQIANKLGNGVRAFESCITSIYISQRFVKSSFEDMINFIKCVGGDADTIGAIAGSIWGASNGFKKLPSEIIAAVEQSDYIIHLTKRLCSESPNY